MSFSNRFSVGSDCFVSISSVNSLVATLLTLETLFHTENAGRICFLVSDFLLYRTVADKPGLSFCPSSFPTISWTATTLSSLGIHLFARKITAIFDEGMNTA